MYELDPELRLWCDLCCAWVRSHYDQLFRYVSHLVILSIILSIPFTIVTAKVPEQPKTQIEEIIYYSGGGPMYPNREYAYPQANPKTKLYPTPIPELPPNIMANFVPTPLSVVVNLCNSVVTGTVGSGIFIWPTSKHTLSGYGYSGWHPGIDLAAHYGEEVLASDSGVVTYAGWSSLGYGNLVIIDSLNGWQTWYAHNSQINVECGQVVNQGDIISFVGSTGHSTGPHLHFEIRFQGASVDPYTVLP